jgi:hypothetical protein
LFRRKHLPNRFPGIFRVLSFFANVDALVPQPAIEFCQILETRPGSEQPFSDIANLVLSLSFLPPCAWCAGNRFNKIMAAQLLKFTIKQSFFSPKNLVHRSLEIVVVSNCINKRKYVMLGHAKKSTPNYLFGTRAQNP